MDEAQGSASVTRGQEPVETGGVRVMHDCMDAGGRATHGAVAEEARTELPRSARAARPLPASSFLTP